MIREAKGRGADLVVTPENTSTISLLRQDLHGSERGEAGHPGVAMFSALAEDLGICLLIGSMGMEIGSGEYANRSFLFSPQGAKVAHYDKIHMFDVAVSETETWRESDTYEPGQKAVMVDLPWGKLGMTVCYDLRFPGLYRDLAQRGAAFLSIPSAFTQPTGAAHWEVLLRARAIECGAFVFAPAQGGTHDNGRKTYGHSLIVGPWGDVLAEADEDPCLLMAKIDPAEVEEARRRLPSLSHDRDYRGPGV
jgi:predicted amidohydrolase